MSTVTGNATSERLYGTSSNDTIYGMGGNDTIYGYAGNDKIDGGAGADSMIGGLGDDTYIIDNSGDIIVEAANQGTDTIIMTANIGNYHMPDNVESWYASRVIRYKSL